MATDYVAKISTATATNLKTIEPDIDIVIDSHNENVIHTEEAEYHLTVSEYEIIEWAAPESGLPIPKKRRHV